MRRKLFVILFALLTIIYILAGALLFFNIQVMEAPEVLIEINIEEINSENAILSTKININNPNAFEIVTKDLKVVTKTADGFEAASVTMESGTIPSNGKKTFTKEILIGFDGHAPETLTSTITGEVGVNFWFIHKTIPLNMGIITSIDNIINGIQVPQISISTEFEELMENGINLSAEIDVYNPNKFEISMENLSAKIVNEKGEEVGHLDTTSGTLAPDESKKVKINGDVLFDAFNGEKIIINTEGTAGVKLAGFTKTIPINLKTNIDVPDLEELLFSGDAPSELSIKAATKVTLRGIVVDMDMSISNTNKIDLVLRDIVCGIYFADNNDARVLIGSSTVEEDVIAKANETTTFESTINIPYSKILASFFDEYKNDWYVVSVSVKLSIKGVDQSVAVVVNGYQDSYILR